MVLPELSRTMAYTTHKIVNRLARKQLHLICGVKTTKGGINLHSKTRFLNLRSTFLNLIPVVSTSVLNQDIDS